MKTIKQDELFDNLRGFLKTKGIELAEGSYSGAIQKSCGLLSDAINLGQKGMHRAKAEMEKALEQARQVIHEKTAPRSAGPKPAPASGAAKEKAKGPAKPTPQAARPAKTAAKPRAAKTRNPKK